MIRKFPELYKRDSKGRTRVWRAEIDGDKIRVVTGLVDGKQTASGWKQMHAKNEGRVNATTPEQQAEAEVASLYEKQRNQGGYSDDLEDIEQPKYIKPMLASPYKDSLPLNFSDVMFSQPKLDGMRCIATKDGLTTRKGKSWVSVPHIDMALYHLFQDNPDVVLDGELYNHDLRDDFNSLSSILRKSKPDMEALAKSADIVEYHVYDIVDTAKTTSERWSMVVDLIGTYQPDKVLMVPTTKVTTEDEVDTLYAEYTTLGYEGQILRYNVPYRLDGRHRDLMIKRKDFFDEEFQIIDIIEGEGNWAGCAKSLLIDLGDGRTSSSGIKGDRKFLAKILVNKHLHVGSYATVRFPNKTPDGKPRFPVAVDIHKGKRVD